MLIILGFMNMGGESVRVVVVVDELGPGSCTCTCCLLGYR